MNSKYSSTRIVHKVTGERCVAHMVNPFDESKTNCGLKIGTFYRTGPWSQNIWTRDFEKQGFSVGEDCARCLRSESSPCETSEALPLRHFGYDSTEKVYNHKMAFTSTGIPTVCVKCGALAERN